MAKYDGTNTSLHPPLWRWTVRKSGGRPPRCVSAAQPLHSKPFPGWRSWSRPLWVEVWKGGGAEPEVRVRGRGWEFVFPGHVTVTEMLLVLNGRPPSSQL